MLIFFQVILNNILLYSTDEPNFELEKGCFFHYGLIFLPIAFSKSWSSWILHPLMYNMILFGKIYFASIMGTSRAKGAQGDLHNFFDLSLHFSWFGNFLEGFQDIRQFFIFNVLPKFQEISLPQFLIISHNSVFCLTFQTHIHVARQIRMKGIGLTLTKKILFLAI